VGWLLQLLSLPLAALSLRLPAYSAPLPAKAQNLRGCEEIAL
jgi:hypothetical protein